ncbi:hypothetical protein ASPWEDRAFT_39091 [Aspergillus wentii DTO 134E9]|uniref:RING-type domain-containing protein n=1 Tax=Aspergillus wentii DTO 134E9 TaxID=1073089 RepID=A0A1L9RR19_ASPWE|nr:uncharacterized protein ASPWEDRAFT_39091 [Aspergillus wentii DTO 134E9]OJJ37406.1 hypothetical protein ASPWEDRAFT_39091 [Aspergillus wentii DTO 134E9]
MNDDSGVQFVGARSRKRPHQMSGSARNRSQSSFHNHDEASSSSNVTNDRQFRPSSPPMRYPGDGFDYRRPIMTSSPQVEDVIDLTNEPDSPENVQQESSNRGPPRHARPPRFGRNIMADVVDLEAEPEPTNGQEPPSSPDVQFVGSNVRPHAPTEDFIGSNLLHMLRFQRRPAAVSEEDVFRQEVARRARQLRRHQTHEVDTLWIGGGGLTINLDADGLIMEYPRTGYTPEARTQRSTYKPPSPPPEGFTRNAGEEDVVVCPNCEAELGTGDETKQQIWVAKPCGHVYCGECARHRSLSKAKKANQTTKPFAKCQVEDCGKPVSAPKSMFQIYL